MEDLDFSNLAPKQRPVIGPDGKKYLLVSATVDATIRYRNAAAKALSFVPDGAKLKATGWNEIATDELVLVANTLVDELTRTPIGEAALKLWPGEAIGKLYKASLELSPWLKNEDTSPKGTSGSTEASSSSPTS